MRNLVPNGFWMHFSKCPARKADAILDALWAAIEEFSEGGPQGDDMTALALCRGAGPTEMPRAS